MKIALKKELANVGPAGTIKEVADGYARNYLFPRGLAIKATARVVKELALLEAKKEEAQAAFLKEAEATLAKLKDFTLKLAGQAEKGNLYGSFDVQDIHSALQEKGFNVPAKFIKIDRPIKKLGECHIPIAFTEKLKLNLKAVVRTRLGKKSQSGAKNSSRKKLVKNKTALKSKVITKAGNSRSDV